MNNNNNIIEIDDNKLNQYLEYEQQHDYLDSLIRTYKRYIINNCENNNSKYHIKTLLKVIQDLEYIIS